MRFFNTGGPCKPQKHYMLPATEPGRLVIFDQRSNQPAISERSTAEQVQTPAGRAVMLIRA